MIYKILFNKAHILILIFLVSCFLSRLNSQFYLINFFGQLSFQILVGGILLFFILLISKKLWSSVICFIICILFASDILPACNNCNVFLKDKEQNYNNIRLMTFNVSYNNELKNFEKLFELILFEKPDIIQFQEVAPQVQEKLKLLKPFFPYNTGINKPLHVIDSVILSKHPLIENRSGDNHAVLTSLILNNTKLTIIGIHLNNPLNQNNFNSATKGINYLKSLVENINQNLILIGDLNMTPFSKRFTNFLKDTNLYAYTSYKNPIVTWPTFLPVYLGIEIDHVLFSKNFKVIEKKTLNHFGSDHKPLIVDLAF